MNNQFLETAITDAIDGKPVAAWDSQEAAQLLSLVSMTAHNPEALQKLGLHTLKRLIARQHAAMMASRAIAIASIPSQRESDD